MVTILACSRDRQSPDWLFPNRRSGDRRSQGVESRKRGCGGRRLIPEVDAPGITTALARDVRNGIDIPESIHRWDGSSPPFGPGLHDIAAIPGSRDVTGCYRSACCRPAIRRNPVRHAEGMYSTQTLLALIQVLAAIPGRKTVLLFSEGLSIDVGERDLLTRILNEANRANVSFYTVNTNGLQTLGSSAQAQASLDWLPLRELAESTGGFSMENSNDLRAPLERVVEDATSHYEIFYQPKSQNFDGRFRRIEVRVNRPGAILQTREGYYALPMLAGQMLQAFEIECLKALDEIPRPHAFSFRREALRFHDIGGQAQYQLAVEIPSSVPRLTMQSDGRLLTGDISVLALVKDASGNVIDKLSRSPGLQVEPSKLESFQLAPLTFTLPIAVPPGQFSVEVAVVDPSSRRASV